MSPAHNEGRIDRERLLESLCSFCFLDSLRLDGLVDSLLRLHRCLNISTQYQIQGSIRAVEWSIGCQLLFCIVIKVINERISRGTQSQQSELAAL